MNSRLTNFVSLVGNASQVIIAGSILAELYMKLRGQKKMPTGTNPEDDGALSPSSSQTPLAA